MITYSKFRPTAFDPKGAFLPDRQNWIVCPTSRTRDSGPFEESNFEAALKILGGESDTVEVHRFGHWGPGWFEIIIIDPNSPEALKAADIEKDLENYPVLDDDDFSEREHSEAIESWESYGQSDFIRALDLPERCHELVKGHASELDLFQIYSDAASEPYCSDSGGTYFPDIKGVAESMTAAEKAELVKKARKG